MKIAVYGVSRSGKDYFIAQFVNRLLSKGIKIINVPGSKTLKDISYQI